MSKLLSTIIFVAVLWLPSSSFVVAADIKRSAWDGYGGDVQEAIERARGSIPQGWLEDSAWTSPIISCAGNGQIQPNDERCLDEFGRSYSVIAILTIRPVE